jgi:hypothetical protein
MRLGFAVKVLGEGGLPSHDARRWRARARLVLENDDRVFDVMLEAKAKDLAVLRLREQLTARGIVFPSWRPLPVR